MPASRPLTEIREADASPEVAAIYADICAASAIPQVNLIYRHLATEPAVLAWAWGIVAPAFRRGHIAAAGAELAAIVPGDGGPPLWAAFPADTASGIEAVIAYYNRANQQNVIALTALIKVARRADGHACFRDPSAELPAIVSESPNRAAPAAPMPLPPLPRRDALDAAIRERIDDLARRQRSGPGVTPSLYLHLAHWPAAIVAVSERVGPLVGTAAFDARVHAVMAEAHRQAERLTHSLEATSQRPPETVLRDKLATLESFISSAIPQMVVVGRILAGAPNTPSHAP